MLQRPGLATHRRAHRWRLAAASAAVVVAAAFGLAHAQPLERDLADLSLEQLGNIEVTSSLRLERLSEAAASIYVITADDLRLSGATSLPEALRLAPTLQVARADANRYAISARGFNDVLANKMLVMVDGRVVYSPLFSGVFWEAQDLVLEDVERIEVITGPAGSSWGTNAVNGVIHVITRSAEQSQGALVVAGAGDRDDLGTLRYGAALPGGGRFRAFAKFTDQDNTERPDGTRVRDASQRVAGGVRGDWSGAAHSLTLIGGALTNEVEQVPGEREIAGGHVLADWRRQISPRNRLRFKAYYDHSYRDQPGAIREHLDTWDVELQHGWRPHARHDLVWGGGLRYQRDKVKNLNPSVLAMIPDDRDLRFASVFVEDEVQILSALSLVFGVKLEENVYTGWETLPTTRLAWAPQPERLAWAAWSRAVRAPSRIDRELYAPGLPPHDVLAGGPDFRSEIVHVAEVGYRAQPRTALSYSLCGFRHEYDRLRSIEPTPSGPAFENRIEGSTWGIEGAASWRVLSWWRVNGGAVGLRKRLRLEPGSADLNGMATLGNDPAWLATLRTSFQIRHRHELSLGVRYVGELPNPHVPAYAAVDARLGIGLPYDLELSVTGYDLVGRSHVEWGGVASRPEFEPGAFVQLRWRT